MDQRFLTFHFLRRTTKLWIGLCSVLHPCQHSIGYIGDGFTNQKTQPTVSKYWRKCYKDKSNNENTKYKYAQTI